MPKLTLIALHGYTMNSALLRAELGPLIAPVTTNVEVVYLDAPHVCPEADVARAYAGWRTKRHAGPYLTWWHASADGRSYEGWERTRDLVCERMRGAERVGLLGFSQGAILAALTAALACRGDTAALAFVILVAGRTPRADVLRPLFDSPLRVPSLHVWGKRDPIAEAAPELCERFDAATREAIVWNGSHQIPRAGPGAEGIQRWIERYAE